MSGTPPAADDRGLHLGRLAIDRSWITAEQLKDALDEQARDVAGGRPQPRKLGNILVTKGYLSEKQLVSLLEEKRIVEAARQDRGESHENPADETFARFVEKALMATAEQIDKARRIQARCAQDGRPVTLAAALVNMGVITPVQRDAVEKKIEARKDGVGQLGRFRLLRKLGEGGMGAVYLAEDTSERKKLALKVLSKRKAKDEDFLRRFIREADAAAQLDHPNIVRAFSFGEDRGYHFYAMEYVDGEGLDQRLKRDTFLPSEEALPLVLQIARGLKYAHGAGFIHRDIKPQNVMIARDGTAKILDLGLTKNLEEEQSFNTMSGIAIGTPHYIAPEQARGEKNVDGRADIYSLGATLYHLVTGDTPFHGSSSFDIITQHLTKQIPDPRDVREEVPESVVHIIRRMMAKKPKDRYRDVAELLTDLELAVDGGQPSSAVIDADLSSVALPVKPQKRRVAVIQKRPASSRKSRLGLAIAGAAAALLVGIVIVVVAAGPRARRAAPDDPPPEPSAGATPRRLESPAPLAIPPRRLTAEEARENDARKKLDELQALERTGRITPDGMRERYEKFAREYGTTSAGLEIADWLKKQAAPVVAKAEPAPEVKPAPPPPEAAPEVAPPPAEAWKQALDLLPLIHSQKDAVAGTWTWSDGALVSDSTGPARVEIPYVPPDEYDLRVVFTRLSGDDCVSQVLTRGGRVFLWGMGHYRNTMMGFERIRNAEMKNHASSVRRTACLENGRRHEAIVQVRNEGLKAFLDGTFITQWKTDYSDLSLGPMWSLREPGVLGLVTWASPTTFHSAQVLEVTGKGRFTREPAAPAVKGAAPDAARQRDAERQIRELFKADYAKSAPADRSALARKLLQQGISARDDAASQFVLCREARDLAVQAGDVDLAFSAIDEMGKAFDVDLLAERAAALSKLESTAREAGAKLAERNMDLAKDLVAADQYDAAQKAAAKALSQARTSKDAGLEERVRSRSKEVQDLQREWAYLAPMRKTLEERPDDGPANLAVGKFFGLWKGDWEQAVRMLARGTDAALRAAAEKDLAAGTDAARQADAGDAWWDLGEKEKNALFRGRLQDRARAQYEKALPGLAGLARVKVEQRMVGFARSPEAPSPAAAKVEAAVQNGVKYLKKRVPTLARFQQTNVTMQHDELVLLALLHGGVPLEDPDVQQLFKSMMDRKLEATYAVALQAILLEGLDRVRYQWRLQQCAQFLVDNQGPDGLWSYGTTSIFAEDIPRGDATLARADPAKTAKAPKKVAVRQKRLGAGSDNSNAVYAVLGLRACFDAGVMVETGLLERTLQWFRYCQKADGGWCYKDHADHKPYGSMTAGATAAVATLAFMLDKTKGKAWKKDRDMNEGLQWLGRNYSITFNPGPYEHANMKENSDQQYFYYLDKLAHAAILTGTDALAGKDWYGDGAAALVASQHTDGAWASGTVDTCFAILFLRRAAQPLDPDARK